MRLNWTYSGCDASQKARITELWQPRQAELEAKAAAPRTERRQMRIDVEHRGASDATVGNLALRLDDPLPATDGRKGLDGIIPILDSLKARQRSDTFFQFIVPLVQSLRPYAHREIRTRRLLGELAAEQLTENDVLDEAMLGAWNEFSSRPKDRPLDLWLIQLIERVIETGSRSIAQESLDARRPQPTTEPRGSRQDQWVDRPDEPETIALARLLPGAPGIEMWDELDVEAKQARLDEIFERLSRPQRQVLMLHTVEGFNTATIADFQDRTQPEVEQDLVTARSILQRMSSEWELPEIEERLEQVTFKRPRRSHRA
jgi:RNA polymerase sigma factor (sigma-70 family)